MDLLKFLNTALEREVSREVEKGKTLLRLASRLAHEGYTAEKRRHREYGGSTPYDKALAVPKVCYALESQLLIAGHLVYGAGSYAVTTGGPEDCNWVFKVCVSPDDCYHAYAAKVMQAAREGQWEPWMPRIKWALVSNGDITLYCIERLYDCPEEMDYPKEAENFAYYEKPARSTTCAVYADLHLGNKMLREDGQVVMTDPWCGHYTNGTSLLRKFIE